MDILILRSFISIMQHRSFVKAAAENNVTTSAVSKRIGKLEEEFGVKFFEQQGKLVIPTPAADKLLPFAKKIVFQYDNALDNIRQPEKFASTINIGLSLHVAQNYFCELYDIIKQAKFPYQIRWIGVSRTGVTGYLNAGQVDLIISTEIEIVNSTSDPSPPQTITRQYLWNEKVECLANKNHDLAKRKNVTLEMLSQYPTLATPPGYSLRDRTDALFEKHDLMLNVIAEIHSLEAIKNILVKKKQAWSILPVQYKSKELVSLKNAELPQTLDVYCYFHKERIRSQVIQSLIQLFASYKIK